jgi:hypothetical protein
VTLTDAQIGAAGRARLIIFRDGLLGSGLLSRTRHPGARCALEIAEPLLWRITCMAFKPDAIDYRQLLKTRTSNRKTQSILPRQLSLNGGTGNPRLD